MPEAGDFLKMDALAAWFLIFLSVIPPMLSAYISDYCEKKQSGCIRKVRLLLGFATAALFVIPVAAHAMLFVIAWELLTVMVFLMVVAEDETEKIRMAGWI
jgi:hydrogenase-4 component B